MSRPRPRPDGLGGVEQDVAPEVAQPPRGLNRRAAGNGEDDQVGAARGVRASGTRRLRREP
jgi:hypothetical protein